MNLKIGEAEGAESIALLTWRDILAKESSKPDQVISYGNESQQFAELWLPRTSGKHPVVVLIHGGCWRTIYPGVELLHHVADKLRRQGAVVWSIEYRRIGEPGGGYPGTFLGVARGADYLKKISKKYNINLRKAVAVGHSAGGHLALWLAVRKNIPPDSPLYKPDPIKLKGVVSIGGIGDLKSFYPLSSIVCGDNTIEDLVGLTRRGDNAYRDTSPAELLPAGIKQTLLYGVYDSSVPPFIGWQYKSRAGQVPEEVVVKTLPDAGHFELIAPWTPVWTDVEKAIFSLLR